jgi:hypothetical protein
MKLKGILIPSASFRGFAPSHWLKNRPVSSSAGWRLRCGSARVRQLTCSGDLNTRMPYLVDKGGPRRLACCQISYRIGPGDDRQIRPAKRLWLLLPSGTLCHRHAGELPVRVWKEGGIKTGSGSLLLDLAPSFPKRVASQSVANRPVPHAH